MVTASGIILGFVLNFATGLVKREYKSDLIVILILISTLIGIVCLIISLFRILNHQYDRENSAKYYSKTLKFFISGVIFFLFSRTDQNAAYPGALPLAALSQLVHHAFGTHLDREVRLLYTGRIDQHPIEQLVTTHGFVVKNPQSLDPAHFAKSHRISD